MAVAALACGGSAIWTASENFANGRRLVLPEPYRERLRAVEQRLPPGARVFYISDVPEYWFSRLWQRLLYPGHETIVLDPTVTRRRFDALRARYDVRYAISAGEHPRDPGYLWKIELGHDSWTGIVWFGELEP